MKQLYKLSGFSQIHSVASLTNFGNRELDFWLMIWDLRTGDVLTEIYWIFKHKESIQLTDRMLHWTLNPKNMSSKGCLSYYHPSEKWLRRGSSGTSHGGIQIRYAPAHRPHPSIQKFRQAFRIIILWLQFWHSSQEIMIYRRDSQMQKESDYKSKDNNYTFGLFGADYLWNYSNPLL